VQFAHGLKTSTFNIVSVSFLPPSKSLLTTNLFPQCSVEIQSNGRRSHNTQHGSFRRSHSLTKGRSARQHKPNPRDGRHQRQPKATCPREPTFCEREHTFRKRER
jgi:hypothetical protein